MSSSTYLFGRDLREEAYLEMRNRQHKLELLNAHKVNIIKTQQQKISLYSLQNAINLIVFYILQGSTEYEIENMSEQDILKLYIKTLIKIKSEVKNPKSSLKVEFLELGEIDSEEFLSDINKYNYKEIETFEEWDKFIHSMGSYFIQYRNLKKLANELRLIDREITLSDKKENVVEARSLIIRILENFTKDDLQALKNNSRGHKGLKSAVFDQLTISEYRKYFQSNITTFKNRWDEIRKLELY